MKAQPIILLLAISTIGLTTVSGQEEIQKQNSSFSDKKTEFNIGIANIFARPIWDIWYYENISQSPEIYVNPQQAKITAGMKFHRPKGAFRINTGFHYSVQNMEDPDVQNDEYRTKLLISDLNLGYEWHSRLNRVTIFYGFDLFGGYQHLKTNSSFSTDFSESKTNIYKYGASPLVGVYYFLTKNLSLGTEVKFNAIGFSSKTASSWQYGVAPDISYGDSQSKTTGFQTWFGPLGYLSVNIHF
jgi:hypothetical protein